MARPVKQGIDYFPLDVDIENDDKLPMIIGEFGFKGEMIFIKLLAYIYKTEGYFIEWNEESQLKFANRVSYITGGAQVNLINQVVARCVKWGLFDRSLHESLNILTNKRIQNTWWEVAKKRKCIEINKNFVLQSSGINPVNSAGKVNDGINPVNVGSMLSETQNIPEEVHKGKESKGKERRVKESIGAPPDFFTKNLDERKAFFKTILKPFVKDYGKEMMREFYDYWIQTATPDRMYFEVQNDFYLNIRLENWKRVGAKSMQQTIDGPKMKEL